MAITVRARARHERNPRRGSHRNDRHSIASGQGQPALLWLDDRGDQPRVRWRPLRRACPQPRVPRRCRDASPLVARPGRRFRRDDGARSEGTAQPEHRNESAIERHTGLDRSRGRYYQRGLLGHSGKTQYALPRVVLRQGGARIHRTSRSLDPERRRPDDLRDEDRQRSDVVLGSSTS